MLPLSGVEASLTCPVCGDLLDESYSESKTCESCILNTPYEEETLRKMYIANKYGLNYYDHLKMYGDQSGGCAICGTRLSMYKDNSEFKTACIDHDHKTGEVRGLLCNNCNIGIGMFKENIGRLFAAANYLKRFK